MGFTSCLKLCEAKFYHLFDQPSIQITVVQYALVSNHSYFVLFCVGTLSSSVESSFLLRQSFTPRQLSKDNRPIVLLLFLTFLHAKDIWRNIHVFQHGLSCLFLYIGHGVVMAFRSPWCRPCSVVK